MASCETESAVVLRLSDREAAALLEVLRYVNDNKWTDPIYDALFAHVDDGLFAVKGSLTVTAVSE